MNLKHHWRTFWLRLKIRRLENDAIWYDLNNCKHLADDCWIAAGNLKCQLSVDSCER